MADIECINLCWKEFQKTTTAAFTNLHGKEDFTDITLVCNTGRQVKAHKVILSAVSIFFKTVFQQNPHQHPLIYLKGVSFEDLNYILDFIYLGEVKVIQEDLETFLNVAEDLQIDGLKRQEYSDEDNQKPDKALNIKVELPFDNSVESIVDNEPVFNEKEVISTYENRLVKGNKSLFCNECDFTSHFKANLKRHKRKFHHSSLIQDYATLETSSVTSHDGSDLMILEKTKNETKMLNCGKCELFFTDSENLEIHMQLEHNKKSRSRKYPCDFQDCDYKASFRSNLKRHIRKIHASEPIKVDLKSALYETENKQIKDDNEILDERRCNRCSFVGDEKKDTVLHKKETHLGLKNFCVKCTKEFSNTTSYAVHMGTHAGVKYNCNFCPHMSTTNSNRKVHVKRMHSEITEAYVDLEHVKIQ